MTYETLYPSKAAAVFAATPSTRDYTSQKLTLTAADAYLTGYSAPDSANRKKKIKSVIFSVMPDPSDAPTNMHAFQIGPIGATFTQSTVTYANAPAVTGGSKGPTSQNDSGAYLTSWNAEHGESSQIYKILHYGLRMDILEAFGLVAAPAGSNKPYIVIVYEDDTAGLTPYGSPSSGYVSKNTAQTFSWVNDGAYDAYTAQSQSSAVFRWRNGTSGTWTSRNLTSGTSVTLPSGSLTGSEMQWYVTVTSSSGTVTSSPIYTLQTAEAAPIATPIYPVGEIVDGQQDVVFTWTHELETGTDQTAADLQISTDAETWSTLGTVSGSDQSYTAAAGTLTPGTSFWRVRTYNADSVAGDWSAAAQMVVVAPPGAPNVTVTASPNPAIQWTAQGQEGYQVIVGPYDTGEVFGLEQLWVPPDFLPDGQYTARVRVANAYGLWSEYGGAVFTVTNVPGNAVTLSAAKSGDNVSLSWTATGYGGFFIYRDGSRIGSTAALSFIDRYAPAGPHSYQVRGIYGNGSNYGPSNIVNVTVDLDAIILTDPEDGTQTRILHCVAGDLAITHRRTRSVTFRYYRGSGLPSAEIAPDESEYYTFLPVFMADERDELEAVRALLGKPIHLRDTHGTALFGIMSEIQEQIMPLYTRLTLAVTAIEHEVHI